MKMNSIEISLYRVAPQRYILEEIHERLVDSHNQVVKMLQDEIAYLRDQVSDVTQQAYEAGLMDGANQ